MLVPAMIYGFYPEVQRRARRMMRAIRTGAAFEEALCNQGLIDTDKHPGLLLLNDADRFLDEQRNFHLICPLDIALEPLIEGKLTPDDGEIIFATCLQSAWGVLLLLPHSLATWVNPQQRWVPFLRAAAQFWSIYEAQGPRYSYGSRHGSTFDEQITTVDYVLTNSGIAPHLDRWEPYRRPPDWPARVEAYAARNPPPMLH